MLRRTFVINALMVLAMFMAACGATPTPTAVPTATAVPKPTATPTPAQQSIVVYTALEDDQIKRYLEPFKAKYPNITVETYRDSTGIVTAKFLAEKDNPKADVIWGLAATSLLVADEKGMLEPYAPAGLDKIGARFRDPRATPHWVGIDAWFSALCVNTKELAAKKLAMPTSWADLIKPEYKGLIGMSNPASSGTGYLSVFGMLQLKGEKEGWAYLDALHNNIKVYVHSGSKPCKDAAAGEYVIGISFDYRAITQKAAGDPIEPVFPKEGSGWDIEANALVKKTTIKPAAKTFLDWAISDSAMTEYAKSYPVTAAKSSVAIPAGYPADPVAQLLKVDFVWAANNRDAILAEWAKRYDSKSAPK
jgi:iron(III) transport system substrate-binding protein